MPNNKKPGKTAMQLWIAELLELHRSGKMSENSEFQPTDADWTDFDDIEVVNCPVCGESNIEYSGEVYDDEEHRGSGFTCLTCGHHFDELDLHEDD